MKITVNGKEMQVADDATVLSLLEEMKLQPAVTVVEHNATIVDRDTYASVSLTEGDSLEFLRFVGGG